MKDERVNINIENITIQNLILTNDNIDFLKSLKSSNFESKDIDFSQKKDNNSNNNRNNAIVDEVPFIKPKRLNAKRNFKSKE